MYLIEILIMALKPLQMLHPASIFGLNIVEETHALKLFFMRPLSNMFCTCPFTSSFSYGIIEFIYLFGRIDPRIKSTW